MASTAGEHDAVRDHILDAVHRVVVRDGLAEASTRAIAEEAGVSIGTLYNYFEDRLQLVAAALLRRAMVLSAPMHAVPARAGTSTVADNLRRAAGELNEMLDRLIPLFAAAFSDAELLEAIRTTMTRGHGASGPFAAHPLEDYLLAEEKLGRVAGDADCRAAASLVTSLCHERAFLDHFFGRRVRRGSLAAEIELIARAIAPIADDAGSGAPAPTSQEEP